MTMSTVDVSEKGFPVSRVSIFASSSFRDRRMETALRRILERSTGGVLDHDGNADLADSMAESIDDGDEEWMVQTALPVEGSTD